MEGGGLCCVGDKVSRQKGKATARHVDVFDLVGPFHNKVLTKVVRL